MRQNDPAVVGAEYEDETRLAVRKEAHAEGEVPDAREVLFEASAETRPRRILEVGCGEGELAERLQHEFATVERRDAHGWLVFPDTDDAQRYIDSLVLQQGSRVPSVDAPIRTRRTPSIFVAEKA